MPLPNQQITDANYRYAFQGQEKDPETGMEAFELRLWDGRLGRWLTVDPYGQYFSPYLGMGNNPISRIDPDGGMDGDPPLFTTAAQSQPVRVYGPQQDGAEMGYSLPDIAVQGSHKLSRNWLQDLREDNWLKDLREDNWLKDLRNFTSAWADENIRPLLQVPEESRLFNEQLREFYSEQVGNVYKAGAEYGLLGSGLGTGRIGSSFSKVKKVANFQYEWAGHLTPWIKMAKNEERAFQHSYTRHFAELGLPNFQKTKGTILQVMFNFKVSRIRNAGLNGFFRSKELVKGVRTTVNRTEPVIDGQRYFYYETLDGKFVSVGKM
ncbi:RHS repeat-associated core domain-containing protein [Flavobacterium amniphilum]|uniref:RHS repeat-associated core domain-containing protein n=1 Tax=Flavobacterium amniphilum TaxID=1834035 RepID=UPI00202A006C|nr:RHS repeat-associated core domain-containing protein [Flavobacterium amniphilum]MCL9807666.1 RHS repeat-associated core domain-containing protein [Flavobacterium amniphilum]